MLPVLLPRIANGDKTAVRECIARYGGLIWSLARRLSPMDAEDAVQDIFVDLWKSAGRFDPQAGTEVTFIATIARRRLIDRRRKVRRDPRTEMLSDALPSDNLPAEVGAEASFAARAVSQLRPEQRQVLVLTTCHGLTHKEVAVTMNMPLGTVKAHARRGLMVVRDALGLGDPNAPAQRTEGWT